MRPRRNRSHQRENRMEIIKMNQATATSSQKFIQKASETTLSRSSISSIPTPPPMTIEQVRRMVTTLSACRSVVDISPNLASCRGYNISAHSTGWHARHWCGLKIDGRSHFIVLGGQSTSSCELHRSSRYSLTMNYILNGVLNQKFNDA